jgi:hypothetical protein
VTGVPPGDPAVARFFLPEGAGAELSSVGAQQHAEDLELYSAIAQPYRGRCVVVTPKPSECAVWTTRIVPNRPLA